MTTVKTQLWFKCVREGCNPSPFAWSVRDVQDAERVVECEYCGDICIPTDPPSYSSGFSRQAIAQYEEIRLDGACNMFDRICVAQQAALRGMGLLNAIALRHKDYALLLQNCSVLMRHYGLQS